jgi:hypothetical protein
MDQFAAHTTTDVLDCFNEHKLDTFLIPGGFTSSWQPLDVSINKPFKQYLKDEWAKWFETDPIFTKKGNRQKPSYGALLLMVSNACLILAEKVNMIQNVNVFFLFSLNIF